MAASQEIARVVYPPATAEASSLVVERLLPNDLTPNTVEAILALRQLSFGTQKNGITDWYAKDKTVREQMLQSQAVILEAGTDQGAERWVMRNPEASNPAHSLDGYVQLTPLDDGTIYLSQIMVRPPFKRGYGSTLLHAALTTSDGDPESPLSLSALAGSGANNFYRGIDMIETDIENDEFVGFETPLGFGIKGIVAALERKSPHLAHGTMYNSDGLVVPRI